MRYRKPEGRRSLCYTAQANFLLSLHPVHPTVTVSDNDLPTFSDSPAVLLQPSHTSPTLLGILLVAGDETHLLPSAPRKSPHLESRQTIKYIPLHLEFAIFYKPTGLQDKPFLWRVLSKRRISFNLGQRDDQIKYKYSLRLKYLQLNRYICPFLKSHQNNAILRQNKNNRLSIGSERTPIRPKFVRRSIWMRCFPVYSTEITIYRKKIKSGFFKSRM